MEGIKAPAARSTRLLSMKRLQKTSRLPDNRKDVGESQPRDLQEQTPEEEEEQTVNLTQSA